jgi:hypothetical protein
MTFDAKILRKQSNLPRYVIVPATHLSGRVTAFEAMVSLNGGKPVLRNIRPWGKGVDAFFFNLTAEQRATAGLDTGSKCTVVLEAKKT